MKIHILLYLILASSSLCMAQYPPAAGKPGSTAISKDSSILVNWAKQCSVHRGWKNIAHKDSGYTTIGDSLSATGAAGTNGVVSLGDSGVIICQFYKPILNKTGFDFAIFENSFDDRFLELAFVEVSSDGRRFFRFPCHSLTDTILQTGPFSFTEPFHVNNLAGKYRAGFGTPFDLQDLPDYKDLNKNSITHIKLVDVVGSLNPLYAGYDTANRKINDPWPTSFPSGGFDLDAIGVIHEQPFLSIAQNSFTHLVSGPNPISNGQHLRIESKDSPITTIEIYSALGSLIKKVEPVTNSLEIVGSDIPKGIFYIQLSGPSIQYHYRGLKQ